MKHEHSLAALCAALGVNRPGYSRAKEAEPGFRARADAQLTEAIRAGMASIAASRCFAGAA